MDLIQLLHDWATLRTEHTHDRDSMNNYGCYNVEACRGCNYVYNARACINCHNCDTVIECTQCVDCRDCAYCIGLNGARFHILNKGYSEQGYYETLMSLGIDWNVEAHG